MKLTKILLAKLGKRMIGYILTGIFIIRVINMVSDQMRLSGNTDIINIYINIFGAIYFALYYIPVFLFFIVNDGDILNHYSIVIRYSSIDIWWAKKFRLLTIDTIIYSFVFIVSMILGVVLYLGNHYLMSVNYILFMVVSFIILYLVLSAIGIMCSAVSFVSKRGYVGFIAGWMMGSMDFILMLIGLDNFGITTVGICTEIYEIFLLNANIFALITALFCCYLISLNVLMYFLAAYLFKKVDIYRGDLT